VSYSCYDSLGWGGKTELKTGKDQRNHLKKGLDTIESKLNRKKEFRVSAFLLVNLLFAETCFNRPTSMTLIAAMCFRRIELMEGF
jgi:hypothetical protein